MEITHECEDNTNKEIMNALYVRENGDVIDLNISFIDKQGHSNIKFLESGELPKGISRQENTEFTAINLDEIE